MHEKLELNRILVKKEANFSPKGISVGFEDLSTSFGADVRALRKMRNKTLSELAEAMGRSVGWMSQVERDISHPTIEELRQLARALDAPISLFFGQAEARAEEAGKIVRASTRRKIGGGDVGLVEELLSPDLTDDFEMLRSEFLPGARLPDYVQRDTQEVGYIVCGKLTLLIEDTEYTLEEGDSFRIKGEKFKWSNPHQETAVVIWVIAPPIY